MTASLSFWTPRLTAISAMVLLTACTTPSHNITLATPAPDSAPATTVADDDPSVRVEPIRYKVVKPGCSGQCPTIEVDSVVVSGQPKLTQLIDHVLAYMTGIDANQNGAYDTVRAFENFFWQTAQSRDSVRLMARVRAAQPGLITVQLDTVQYVTGAAHDIPATQFLNWQVNEQRVLALEDAIVPGQEAAWEQAQRQAHDRWKRQQEDYLRDPATFDRMWPYQPTDNFALTRAGVLLKYSAYAIAPYSSGQPEILMPYTALSGIIRPDRLAR